MNKLLLTAALLTTVITTVVQAQNYEQDYDVINRENLQNQTGFVGLEVGNQISRDNMNAQSNTVANNVMRQQPAVVAPMQPTYATTPSQPTVADVQIQTVPQAPLSAPQQQQAQVQTPAAPMASYDNTMAAVENDMGQTANDFIAIEPAAGDVSVDTVVVEGNTPELVMQQDVQADVTTTRTIIGNTDTGVDPEVVLRALEGQN